MECYIAEHTVLECARWVREGEELEMDIGARIVMDNIVAVMLKSRKKWESLWACEERYDCIREG